MPSLIIFDWSLYTTSLTPSALESSTHGNDPGQTGISNPYVPTEPTWTGVDFTFNGGSGSVIDINDDDAMFEDAYVETGGPQTLAADVTINGTTYLAGSVVQNEFSLLDPSGNQVWVVRIGGVNVGFTYPEGDPPLPGEVFNANDTRDGAGEDSLDQVTPSGELYGNIVCFAAGTLIRTPSGEVPVEVLQVGDRVTTMDDGPQPLTWVACRELTRAVLDHAPHLRPVLIPAGVLGTSADLLVSPQHRMLLGPEHGLEREALVSAKHLVEVPGPVRVAHGKKRVIYHHLLLSRHQILFANGAASESFYPGPEAIKMLPPADRLSLLAQIPGIFDTPPEVVYGAHARRVLKRSDLKGHLKLQWRGNMPKPAQLPGPTDCSIGSPEDSRNRNREQSTTTAATS